MNILSRHARSQFFDDDDLEFATRGLLGRAWRGATEVGEVLAAIDKVKGRDDWSGAWAATAQRAQDHGDAAREQGHLPTAARHYLRASTYWGAAVDGLTTGEDEAAITAMFKRHRAAWDLFIDASEGRHVRVDIPYEETTLPGYLLRPDATGQPRPTLIITNGSDGCLSDLWTTAAAGALDRGWNAVVYDGPGQQSMLFERHTYFRPDWEAVLTPVVDALVTRDDVDPDALSGYGVSQAGYWLTRAIAYEHRLKAAVVDPGVVDVATSWMKPIGGPVRRKLDEGDREGFNKYLGYGLHMPGVRRTLVTRGRPFQHDDWFDLFSDVQKYRIDADTAALIKTPLLITEPDDESFWPDQSQQLAALLPGAGELLRFSRDDGAGGHCEPTGRQIVELAVFDWLTARVGS